MHRASIAHGVLVFTSKLRCLQKYKAQTARTDSRGSSLEKRVCQRCGRRVRESAPASQEVGQRLAAVERRHGDAVGESDEDPLAKLLRQAPRQMVEQGSRRKPDTNIAAGHRVAQDLPGNKHYPPTPPGHRSVGGYVVARRPP